MIILIKSLIAIGVVCLTYLLSLKRPKAPKGHLPIPGPKGVPFFGNTFQLGDRPEQQLVKWAEQYGEIFQVQLGWDTWVFINTPQGVKEVFDKQSALTSGRRPLPVSNDLISQGMRMVLMDYTPRWRKMRAIVHKLLTPKMSDTFQPSQLFEAKQLVYDILTDNKHEGDFYMHARRYSASVVLTAIYGKRIPKWDCDEIREIYTVMQEFSDSLLPSAYLANLVPALGKLPTWLQWWRSEALKCYERQAYIWMKFWTELADKVKDNKAPECFVKQMLEKDSKKDDITELQAAFVAGTMIEAGSETTSSAINTAILYMANDPTIQSRAHRELDEVVGKSPPTFEHVADLPYIRAIVKETFRIRPILVTGAAHYTNGDVTYKDYFIPKGTVVSASQYALSLDAKRYENPKEFHPERYLEHPERAGVYAAHPDPNQRDHFGFGVGRRICPGMHLAENSLIITIAKILWTFRIEAPSGEKMDISDGVFENGAIGFPRPFRAKFIARDEQRAEITRKEWLAAKEEGFYLGSVQVNVQGVSTE